MYHSTTLGRPDSMTEGTGRTMLMNCRPVSSGGIRGDRGWEVGDGSRLPCSKHSSTQNARPPGPPAVPGLTDMPPDPPAVPKEVHDGRGLGDAKDWQLHSTMMKDGWV